MNTDQKIIKNKVGLLNLAQMLGSVSQACKMMGYSRDSFYRQILQIGNSSYQEQPRGAPLRAPAGDLFLVENFK